MDWTNPIGRTNGWESPHWLWVNGVKIIVGEDMLATPDGGLQSDLSSLPMLQQWFQAQSETAGKIGHVVFYFFATLVALALIKRFPYRWFAKTHTILAAAYLVYVHHSVVLMDFGSWHLPIGIVSGALMVAGTIAAVLVLTRHVGHNRKAKGVIEQIDLFPELGVMETSIRLQDGWKGHQAGQFAFVTFDPGEGAHPFTIGSAWKPEAPFLTFITKGLGDYTRQMVENLKIGDGVVVEGPYGRFTFADENKRQIWIGAGIGVTPFIARMKQLVRDPQDQIIDLFVVGPVENPKVKRKLTADANAANVRLHIVIDGRDDQLTGKGLGTEIPNWQGASVWFCGPVKFGESLKRDMIANGLRPADFRQELFNMR